MMDLDNFSYIFGSFARRRSSQERNGAKRRSIEPTIIQLTPPNSKKPMISVTKTKNNPDISEDTKYQCPMCKKRFEDPRVLPCLHTVCLKCLQQLEQADLNVRYDEESEESRKTDEAGSSKNSSAGSGYLSDKPSDSSTAKGFYCPSCGTYVDIPKGGVSKLLPNYLLLRKITVTSLNDNHNLCSICTSDKSALFRCTACKLNLCDICEDVHHRQKPSLDHEVLLIDGAKSTIKRLVCQTHPENELNVFCSSCYEVICGGCAVDKHIDHVFEPVSRAIKTHFAKLRLLSERARNLVEESALAAGKLDSVSKQIETRCNEVQDDVEKFIGEYVRSVEDHKLELLEQIKQVRRDKLECVHRERAALRNKLRGARDVSGFLSDLLSDGTDAEILSFVHPVLNRAEMCGDFEAVAEVKLSGSLQFLKEETVKCPNNFFSIYGVLTTQNVSPDNSVLDTAVLQNLRVGKKVEILLETRDNDGLPIERGGDEVIADIRHRDAGVSKSLLVNVKDKKNGNYIISFTPDVPGKLILNVNINKKPVKGSPFPVIVRTIKQHVGIFHCCTFCSSRGNKDAVCGCSGTMPGGYKGCGHGHEGHPGRRHWSCCGIILQYSECTRTKQPPNF
ncbi:tripartite motif-containing protein 45 [Diorhabda sublineata]|uniref:tripartite motif-containing protein 45 n=1 Tax=Diorhabda sublineata TaxID=1163346 RepID=UPI0024E05313|nr:tripartite motif-containing protein 45 [Diorhabda sublineata]